MKTTRSFNLVKGLLLAMLAAGLSASLASAQDFRGRFTLPFAASWGGVVLSPGDYTLELDAFSAPHIVTIRQGARGVAVVMENGRSKHGNVAGPSALIAERSGGRYRIRALHLAEEGVDMEFLPPRAERIILAEAPVLIRRVPISMAGN